MLFFDSQPSSHQTAIIDGALQRQEFTSLFQATRDLKEEELRPIIIDRTLGYTNPAQWAALSELAATKLVTIRDPSWHVWADTIVYIGLKEGTIGQYAHENLREKWSRLADPDAKLVEQAKGRLEFVRIAINGIASDSREFVLSHNALCGLFWSVYKAVDSTVKSKLSAMRGRSDTALNEDPPALYEPHTKLDDIFFSEGSLCIPILSSIHVLSLATNNDKEFQISELKSRLESTFLQCVMEILIDPSQQQIGIAYHLMKALSGISNDWCKLLHEQLFDVIKKSDLVITSPSDDVTSEVQIIQIIGQTLGGFLAGIHSTNTETQTSRQESIGQIFGLLTDLLDQVESRPTWARVVRFAIGRFVQGEEAAEVEHILGAYEQFTYDLTNHGNGMLADFSALVCSLAASETARRELLIRLKENPGIFAAQKLPYHSNLDRLELAKIIDAMLVPIQDLDLLQADVAMEWIVNTTPGEVDERETMLLEAAMIRFSPKMREQILIKCCRHLNDARATQNPFHHQLENVVAWTTRILSAEGTTITPLTRIELLSAANSQTITASGYREKLTQLKKTLEKLNQRIT